MHKLNVPGPKALALIDRDKKVISSSYPPGYPFVMDHGKGVEVWDPDGNRFIDMMGGIAVVATGHANPKVVKAVQSAAKQWHIYHAGLYQPLSSSKHERTLAHPFHIFVSVTLR